MGNRDARGREKKKPKKKESKVLGPTRPAAEKKSWTPQNRQTDQRAAAKARGIQRDLGQSLTSLEWNGVTEPLHAADPEVKDLMVQA